MSIRAMGQIVARRATSEGEIPVVAVVSGDVSTGQQLLETIGAYIPTDIATAYIAAAGGIATLQPPLSRHRLLLVVIGMAVLSVFSTWVIGHKRAQKATTGPPPKPLHTLKAGWYEISTAGLAFFVWGTAMPGSWLEFGRNAVWAPPLVVFVASIAIGGVAALLNRPQAS